MFASLITFCFSQYGNELAAYEGAPINGWVRLPGSFVGTPSSGEKLTGFHAADRLLTQCVIHLGILECWL